MNVLHNPPRPLRIFMPKSRGKGDNHNNVVNTEIIMELNQREVFMGLMLYEITWLLMLYEGLT